MNSSTFIGMLFTSLGAILGVAVIIVKPLLETVKTMQSLRDAIEHLTEQFSRFELNNHDDHKRIWQKNEQQDAALTEHDKRLSMLEKGDD